MEKKCAEEGWALINSTENSAKTTQDNEEHEEDEELEEVEDALSLCDLPLIHHSTKEENVTPLRATDETQENFDFCCSLLEKPEMCTADEVFFQGQILPLSSKKAFSRSQSMDHYSSYELISSRSSSISSSHHSSSSGSSGGGAAGDPKSRPPNPFQYSHPNPSPKLRLPSNRQGITTINNMKTAKKSSAWTVFRLGLLAPPPEIAFHELKTRSHSNNSSKRKNFGSRNSTSTNSSSVSSSSDKKKRIFKPKALFGGCKCTFGAVDTVPSKVVIIKRSASDGESEVRALRADEDENNLLKSPKKRASHHRTFEWLKQLSLEGTVGDD